MLAIAICAGLLLAPISRDAMAQTATPAATAKSSAKKPPSAAQVALRERQKKCGAEWKAAKTAGTIEKGMKWPQYWSACNKRLKSGT
jgi:hypothetical protein